MLLGDILRDIMETAARVPSQILMKIDIEHFECRAFLGSPEVLSQPQIIPIIAVVMEWIFTKNIGGGQYGPICKKEQVRELARLFLDTGYTPFKVDSFSVSLNGLPQFSKLDISNFGLEWNCDVVWLSNYVVNNVSSIVNVLGLDSI